MWFVTICAVFLVVAQAPEPTAAPRMHACLARADAVGNAADAAVARRAFAFASHLFVRHAQAIDACGVADGRDFGPGVRIFAANRYLQAGQAAHLAGDEPRARRLVRVALDRLQRLHYIDPEPAALYNLDLTGYRRSAEDDLKGIWTVF